MNRDKTIEDLAEKLTDKVIKYLSNAVVIEQHPISSYAFGDVEKYKIRQIIDSGLNKLDNPALDAVARKHGIKEERFSTGRSAQSIIEAGPQRRGHSPNK
jgi:hypothetical protein